MRGMNGVVADKVEGELPCVLVAVEPSALHSSGRTGPDQTNRTHAARSNVSLLCVHECNMLHTQADARHVRLVSALQRTQNVWQMYI